MRADVIDLSHYDDVTDAFAGTVRMGVLGVVNKLTEGLGAPDQSFVWRKGPAAAAGLRYGAYHFLRHGDPKGQARHFLDALGDPTGLRLALDHEDAAVPMTDARTWLETVHDALGGHWPHYYSYQAFIAERHSQMNAAFWRQVPLWLAAYNSNPQWPQDIWAAPDMLQFTGDGNGPLPHRVPGITIAGGCDISQARDRASLIANWATIRTVAPPSPTPPPPVPPSPDPTPSTSITGIAANSEIAHYAWSGRGVAPIGYIKGIALTFARVLAKLKARDPAAKLMAQANTHDPTRDALSWYAGVFNSRGMSNDADGPDTLRHLFALLMGLGMRESSGEYTEGRDMSAGNVTADTAEAGLFQQSWGTHVASPEIAQLMTSYQADTVDGLAKVFGEGASKPLTQSYGSGPGRTFQELCKKKPAFAVEAAAIGLRVVRAEWGPIDRREAELRVAADTMLKQVQAYVATPPAIMDINSDVAD